MACDTAELQPGMDEASLSNKRSRRHALLYIDLRGPLIPTSSGDKVAVMQGGTTSNSILCLVA